MRCFPRVLACLLLACVIAAAGTPVFAQGRTAPVVSEELAGRAAARYLYWAEGTVCPRWSEPVLGEPLMAYDIAGAPLAYVFPVYDAQAPGGYVTVSTTLDSGPVLEASGSPVVDFERLSRLTGDFEKKGLAVDLIYVPPFTYILRCTEPGGERYLVDPETLEHVALDPSMPHWSPAPNESSRLAWDRVSEPVGLLGYDYVMLDVPNYTQQGSGCGWCAGAMVLAYHDSRGYPELKHAADNSNADDLQGCLAHDMGGPPVTFGMAESGVEKHANTSHHNSGHFTYNCTYHFDAISALSKDGVKNTWTGYKRELAGSRPPMVYADINMPLPDIKYH